MTKQKIKKEIKVIGRKIKANTFDYKNYKLEYHSVKDLPYPTDWKKFYDYRNLNLEIGCGHGELIEFVSREQPDDFTIGFEITKRYTKMANSKLKGRDNAIVLKGDGFNDALNLFADKSLKKINILFPDPWHKKKHNKRRPVNHEWLKEIANKLEDDGEIFFATDWYDYYQFVLEHLDMIPGIYQIEVGEYDPEELGYPKTHYYKKWLRLDRDFNYIRMTKS